jgi:hypothetical protein
MERKMSERYSIFLQNIDHGNTDNNLASYCIIYIRHLWNLVSEENHVKHEVYPQSCQDYCWFIWMQNLVSQKRIYIEDISEPDAEKISWTEGLGTRRKLQNI